MTYIPQKNKKAQRISFLCIIFGIVSAAAGSILPKPWIMQVAALVLIVAGVQLLVRFVLSDHRYLIDDLEDGSSDLIVYKKQGSRDIKVCHISLSSVTDIYPRSEKKQKTEACYNYSQNLGADAYSVVFHDGRRYVEVILECDAAFVTAIEKRIGMGDGDGTRFVM